MSSLTRSVLKSVLAIETKEGVGAVVRRRFVETMVLRNLTPSLTLNHFRIGKGSGFSDYPHRAYRHILQATHFLHSRRQRSDRHQSDPLRPTDMKILPVIRELLNLEESIGWPLAKEVSDFHTNYGLAATSGIRDQLFMLEFQFMKTAGQTLLVQNFGSTFLSKCVRSAVVSYVNRYQLTTEHKVLAHRSKTPMRLVSLPRIWKARMDLIRLHMS